MTIHDRKWSSRPYMTTHSYWIIQIHAKLIIVKCSSGCYYVCEIHTYWAAYAAKNLYQTVSLDKCHHTCNICILNALSCSILLIYPDTTIVTLYNTDSLTLVRLSDTYVVKAVQKKCVIQKLFSLGWGINKSFRFGPQHDTKVTFNTHPPTHQKLFRGL